MTITEPDQQLDPILMRFFLDSADGLGTDDAVADLVPDYGLEMDITFAGEVAVNSSLRADSTLRVLLFTIGYQTISKSVLNGSPLATPT